MPENPTPKGRLRKRGRRALIALGIVLALWLIGSFAVASRLTHRHRPIFKEPVPTVAWGRLEPLRLRTSDGLEIGAWFAPGRAEKPVVLLLHGNKGSRRSSLQRAELFAGGGCGVLMITFRAHGDSAGEVNDIGYSARHDVIAAVEYLERRCPKRPVVVHGTSLGAAAATFAAGDLAGRVRGYILESPYRDLKTAVRNRTRANLPPGLDALAYAGLRLVAPIVLPQLDQIAPVEAIGAIPARVPVLILAGGADILARPEEARALLERVRGHGRLELFERATHHDLPRVEPSRYRRSLLGFVAAIGPLPTGVRVSARLGPGADRPTIGGPASRHSR